MPIKGQLTSAQVFFLIVLTQVGFGILSLPHLLHNTANKDGWISILLAGICIQLLLLVYWYLLKRFPHLTYPEITKTLLGSKLGILVNTLNYIYFLFASVIILINTTKIIHIWLLIQTPQWVVGLLIILTCLYLAICNIQIIARFFIIASLIIFLLIFMSFLTFSLPMDFYKLFPIGSQGISDIRAGIKHSFVTLVGFEVILYLYSYAKNKDKKFLKTLAWSNIFVVGLTIYFFILCMLIFSDELIKQISYPLLYVFRPLKFDMVDRIDLFIVAMWILPIILSIVIYLHLASKNFLIKPSRQRYLIIINGMIVFLLFLLAKKDPISIDAYSRYILYQTYIVLGMPIILLLLSLLIKKEAKRDQ